jgi:hypothetical protein
MDDRTVDAARVAPAVDPEAISVDGTPAVSFTAVVSRLSASYPNLSVTHIETVVLREWEAFSAGRPLVVPAGVESGVREMLDRA